jgi:multidrug resistance efflux pump
MFSSIRIAIILTCIGLAGGGFLWIKKLQNDLETARANVAKMEVAVATAEATTRTLQEEAVKMAALNQQLSTDLQKAEQYGDELRATLQRHNLTHLASQKPGLIEKRMQGATDKLWDDLADITDPDRVRESVEPGTADSSSN